MGFLSFAGFGHPWVYLECDAICLHYAVIFRKCNRFLFLQVFEELAMISSLLVSVGEKPSFIV